MRTLLDDCCADFSCQTRRAGEAAVEGAVPGWRQSLKALLSLVNPDRQASSELEEAEGFGEAASGKVICANVVRCCLVVVTNVVTVCHVSLLFPMLAVWTFTLRLSPTIDSLFSCSDHGVLARGLVFTANAIGLLCCCASNHVPPTRVDMFRVGDVSVRGPHALRPSAT